MVSAINDGDYLYIYPSSVGKRVLRKVRVVRVVRDEKGAVNFFVVAPAWRAHLLWVWPNDIARTTFAEAPIEVPWNGKREVLG